MSKRVDAGTHLVIPAHVWRAFIAPDQRSSFCLAPRILRGHTQGSLFEARGMKIWSTPHGDMGIDVNYNGPKVGAQIVHLGLPL